MNPTDRFALEFPRNPHHRCATVCRAVGMLAAFALLGGCSSMVTPVGDTGRGDASLDDVQTSDHAVGDVSSGTDVSPGVCHLPGGEQCARGQVCSTGPCSACRCDLNGVLTCFMRGCSDAGDRCFTDGDCPTGDTCTFDSPGCEVAGQCQPTPVCNGQLQFCACDGTTHRGCVANAPYVHAGACEGPDAGSTCQTAADCPNMHYCIFETAGCGLPGTCGVPPPCSNPTTYCGCDGHTFSSCAPPVPYAFVGACSDVDAGPVGCAIQADCPRDQVCAYDVPGCGVRGHCEPPVLCDVLLQFCGCDGATFTAQCVSLQPYAYEGRCETPDAAVGCRTSSDCSGGQLCVFEAPGCGVLGTCSDAPDCAGLRPYCACDGTTTFYACVPMQPFAYAGACALPDAGPTACGSNADCAPGDVCVGPPGCGASWTCVAGTACTNDLVAYCGCDGATFYASSSCPGQPFAFSGPCSGADAGTTVECDPTTALCNSPPPSCPSGSVASVVNGCWGDCVPFSVCAPIACDPSLVSDPHCPAGGGCDGATRTCQLWALLGG